MYRLLGLALVFTLTVSCQQSNVRYDKAYFDFDSLIQNQVNKLGKAKWKKTSHLNERTDTVVIQPDSMGTEFEIFSQLDVINKPVFKDRYSIEEKKDVHSNLMVRRYSFKPDNKDRFESSVPFVEFYYYNRFDDLRKIVSAYNESNLLFKSGRELTLEFEENQPKKINAYSVRGFQKMLFADSVKMTINVSRLD